MNGLSKAMILNAKRLIFDFLNWIQKKLIQKVFSILHTSYILVSQLQKCMVEKPDVYSNIFRLNI